MLCYCIGSKDLDGLPNDSFTNHLTSGMLYFIIFCELNKYCFFLFIFPVSRWNSRLRFLMLTIITLADLIKKANWLQSFMIVAHIYMHKEICRSGLFSPSLLYMALCRHLIGERESGCKQQLLFYSFTSGKKNLRLTTSASYLCRTFR